VRRHPKAFAMGSTLGTGPRRAGFGRALAMTLAVAAVLAATLTASAQAAPLGVVGYSGNPGTTGETTGGRFSTAPRGVAVNNSNGRVYVADTNNNRIQRFSATGVFERAIGFDVIQAGKPGDTGTGFEICTVAEDCKAGINSVSPALGGEFSAPQAVAVNQATGDFYVTEGSFSRVQQFDADGNFIRAWGGDVVQTGQPGDSVVASAVQTLTVDAGAGTYKLGFQGQITGDIASGASAGEVQTALQGLSSIGAGNLTVTGGPGAAGGGTPYTLTFAGARANARMPLIEVVAGSTPLSGGAGTATVAQVVAGSNNFEICNQASSCKTGVGGGTGGAFSVMGYVAVTPVGAPNAGNVLVAEGFNRRVQEFTATGDFVRGFGFDVVSVGPSNAGAGFEVCRAAAFDICKAGVAGAGVGQFANFVTAPNIRLAADTQGAIYTVEPAGNFRVQKFTPSGGTLTPALFNPQIDSLPGETPTVQFPLTGTAVASAPTDIAVDPTDNHVYVVKGCTTTNCPGPPASTERRLYEFDSSSALIDTHLAGYNAPAATGLAVKSGGELAYLSSPSPKAGVYILGEPVPPTATVGATTAITATTAVFHGTVNPNGGETLHTFYRFEYSADGGSSWTKATPADVDAGGGETPVAVQQTVAGLEPNRDYKVRLVATKGGSPTVSADTAGDFRTLAAPPTVETFAAFWDTSVAELLLRGSVNPNNSPASYYFEYGTRPCSSSSCESIPVSQNAPVGFGGQPVIVSQRVLGLAPGTTYHFLIVAQNGVGGEVRGVERTLTTPEAGTCANQVLRVENNSAALAECRAFEWVSNGDSWGSGINQAVGSIADSGERALFFAQAFGQPQSVPGPSTSYVAERGPAGWTARGMLPEAHRAEGSSGGTYYMTADDLGATLWPESSFGQRQRGEVQWGLLGLDGSVATASDLLIPLDHSGAGAFGDQYPLKGASSDLTSFVFYFGSSAAGVKMVPDESLLGEALRSNLYVMLGGELDVVNRVSDPSPGVPGAIIGGACGAGLGANLRNGVVSDIASNAVSADGAIVYFTVRPGAPPPSSNCGTSDAQELALAGPKRLFKRINGETTVEISACGKANPLACTAPGDDKYRGASRDGTVVFFMSPRQLTDTDTDATEDLYAYDASLPAPERLIQASAGEVVAGDHPVVGAGAEVQGVFDNSADGSRVYFTAKGRLTAAASKGATNLYVFKRDAAHPGGRIDFLGVLTAGETRGINDGDGPQAFALPSGENGDGRFLLFTTAAKLLAEDTDLRRDLYRYEDSSGELICASCAGEDAFNVAIAPRPVEASWSDYSQKARPASDDVSALVFTTSEGLVDEDLNGAKDIYLWREGSLSLISQGSGEAGIQTSARESGISPDGEDVFFITRTGLVGADRNNGLDLYDARVGGGFAAAVERPICTTSDGCQGPLTGGPSPEGGGGSDAIVGPGNPPQPRPCKKGKVRRTGKCVKKPKGKARHGKRSGKRAGHDRGGNR
jgi:hypothetical protein